MKQQTAALTIFIIEVLIFVPLSVQEAARYAEVKETTPNTWICLIGLSILVGQFEWLRRTLK